MYYRKTIKMYGIKWDDYLRDPHYASDYTLSVTEGCIIILCFLLWLPTGGDRARQTLPGEWEATVSTSGKLKIGMKHIFLWSIIFHIVLLCFVASWTIKLFPHNATATKPYTDLYSTTTWQIRSLRTQRLESKWKSLKITLRPGLRALFILH